MAWFWEYFMDARIVGRLEANKVQKEKINQENESTEEMETKLK